MLAERKKRVKWSLNPCGNFWSHDTSKYGQQMLEKMGWKPGCGLGANEQGITEQIKVAYKNDKKCIGYKEHGDEWLEQQSQFEKLLAELSGSHDAAVSDKGNESLELRSQQSRARVHYHRFTRGKDISNYTDKDLACILGVKKPSDISDCGNIKEKKNDMDTLIGKIDNLYGVTTVNGGNMSDYFIKKKQKNVDDALAKNDTDIEKEQLGSEFGDNECKAKIKTNKKQKHKNTESSNTQKREVDGEETKNELAMNSESTDVNGKKRKRKLEGAKEEYLLKKDEESHEETDIKEYSKEDECNFTQEIETRRKHKVNPNINGKEVQEETGEDEMNDSGSYLNYKRKKRKLEKEIEEHLLVEEGTVKQDGRMSFMESYNEKDMHSCELEDNKIKRKKKRKEKDTDCPDAQGKEVEAEVNEMTVLNGNTVTSSNYKKKKRKSKQEVKERMEDEITEQGKRVNDNSNSSFPTVCYMSEIICEKYSLQENNDSVGGQDIAPAGDKAVHKKKSGKLKNHKSIDRNTDEVDHGETKDHKPIEEENIKHKVKKKKIRRYSKDENIHDIQEYKHVQHNLEETLTESCNRK
ncbi:hypothetical protein B7P43_G13917, partial [Cryptotermes secundus]